MTDKRVTIGALTPEQRDLVLATVSYLRRTGQIQQQTAAGQQNVHHYVKNVSGEEIPAYACMQVTGTVDIGGQNYLEVDKPADTDSSSGHYIFNSFEAIEIDGLGVAYDGPLVRVITSETGVLAGDELGPSVGSWEVTAGGTLLVAAGDDDIKTGVVKAFVQAGGGSSCDYIRFSVDSVGEDTCGKYAEATVLAYPCGCGTIPGMDAYGKVRVYDMIGCFLFDELDHVGKQGYAKYMVPLTDECPDDDPYTIACKWEMAALCCGEEITPVGTSLQYHTNTDEYGNVTEYCIRMNRYLMRTCPQLTTPSDLCGDGPCPEGDCPEAYV